MLQAINKLVFICYDYSAAANGSSWGLSKVTEELKDLRNIHESVEQLSKDPEGADPTAPPRLPNLIKLYDPNHGSLASYMMELERLSEKLHSPNWASHDGSKRKALVQSLSWPLKEGDTKKALEDIGRLKTTLTLAMTTDQA